MDTHTKQGFPNGVDWGQFGQNGQKLHENDKISIFGSKQLGGMRGQANFSGSGGIPPQSPPLGETLPKTEKLIENT